jgi:Protein of unknown function (DUF3800)
LFNGSKRFDKTAWPLPVRLAILDELADIPRHFNLPVFHCSIDRVAASAHFGEPCGTPAFERAAHAYAYFYCSLQVETFLRTAAPDEVALMIAEDREQVRRMLKYAHNINRGRIKEAAFVHEVIKEGKDPILSDNSFPFDHVIESIQFAQKSDSSLLQIADICAFAIKRWIMRKPHAERLFAPISRNFIYQNMPIGLGEGVQSVSLATSSS